MSSMLLRFMISLAFLGALDSTWAQNAPAADPTQSYGTIGGATVISYSDFMSALRRALSKQVGDIGPYSKEIETISKLASQCPESTPQAGFRQKNRGGPLDPYYNTNQGRTCELDQVGTGAPLGGFIPKPLVSNSGPRKLYVYAGAQGQAIAQGSEKAAFRIMVSIEPKDISSLDKRCIQGGPWNDILSHCMQPVIDAAIITDREIAALQRRNEKPRNDTQVSAHPTGDQETADEKTDVSPSEVARAAYDYLKEQFVGNNLIKYKIATIDNNICHLRYSFFGASDFYMKYEFNVADIQPESIKSVSAKEGNGWAGIVLNAASGKRFKAEGRLMIFGNLAPSATSIKLVAITTPDDVMVRAFVKLATECGAKRLPF